MNWAEIVPNIIHLGAVLYLICFLFRDQFWLRMFAIAGDVCYTLYYFVASTEPLWGAIYWSVLNLLVNIVMIYLILRDKRMSSMSDDDMRLFRLLPGLSPGQFRKVMTAARWQRAGDRTRLTKEGGALDSLHYVLEGKIDIAKSGQTFSVGAETFIGELAFLRDKPATATVDIARDGLYVTWSSASLKKLLDRNDDLRNAFHALLSRDMAEKVAMSSASGPIGVDAAVQGV